MGRVRRGGYILVWWKSDHSPSHMHVLTAGGKLIGRLNLATYKGLEGWTPTRKLINIIDEIKCKRGL
jgi:hypothetical protein